MRNEADTCRVYVLPALSAAGWTDEHIREQYYFTAGRIVGPAGQEKRAKPGKVDYLLSFRPDVPLAVVEAKAEYKQPDDGLGQAKNYAGLLGLMFAYSTNGLGIVEFDQTTGETTTIPGFPSPDELWRRLRQHEGLETEQSIDPLLQSDNSDSGKQLRYYQRIAINRTVEALAKGRRRVLVTMATGTGKTEVAFQICWKLNQARWNVRGDHQEPRILFLADRRVLVDDPMAKEFAPFKEARYRIDGRRTGKARTMYFATYQTLAGDGERAPVFRKYPRDFFDLVIVDECHRGSAEADSEWRRILDYFEPAAKLGMTATPVRKETRDSYAYFGNPIYTYSLRSGIEDGFLAPYRVHRIVTEVDATGWRPAAGEIDLFGNPIPDAEYGTPDFERKISLKQRTKAIARYLVNYMHETDPMAKTIVFCADQEHASEMAREIGNLNRTIMKTHPDYVVRVTSDEGEIGRGHLSHFQDVERTTPVVLTTSQLLTTGVDAPMCKNIVIARMVGSMVEFKQIIGRGTRVREEYGKLSFTILDFTGSATKHFADPDFDGEPESIAVTVLDPNGDPVRTIATDGEEKPPPGDEGNRENGKPSDERHIQETPRKYHVDGSAFGIAARIVYELDPDGNVLRVLDLTDYAGARVRTLVSSLADLRGVWLDAEERERILEALAERGLTPESIANAANAPEADTFDLLCHLAFDAPLHTRRERATRVAKEQRAFFERFSPVAREILEELLEKYAEHGITQLQLPDALKIAPISDHGNVIEIAEAFGGGDQLRQAVIDLQRMLYEESAA